MAITIDQLTHDIQQIIIKTFIEPTIDFMTSKGLTVTSQEVLDYLVKNPVSSRSSGPRVSPVVKKPRAKKVVNNEDVKHCTHVMTRPPRKGENCGKPTKNGEPFCTTHLAKNKTSKTDKNSVAPGATPTINSTTGAMFAGISFNNYSYPAAPLTSEFEKVPNENDPDSWYVHIPSKIVVYRGDLDKSGQTNIWAIYGYDDSDPKNKQYDLPMTEDMIKSAKTFNFKIYSEESEDIEENDDDDDN